MNRRAALAWLAASAGTAAAPWRPAWAQAAPLPAVVVWDFDNQSPLPGAGEFARELVGHQHAGRGRLDYAHVHLDLVAQHEEAAEHHARGADDAPQAQPGFGIGQIRGRDLLLGQQVA